VLPLLFDQKNTSDLWYWS